MLLIMLAAVLFALLVGALAFVTGPVGLAMAAAIALWLLLYAARGVLRARSAGSSAPVRPSDGRPPAVSPVSADSAASARPAAPARPSAAHRV